MSYPYQQVIEKYHIREKLLSLTKEEVDFILHDPDVYRLPLSDHRIKSMNEKFAQIDKELN
jgi:hypothetical protein